MFYNTTRIFSLVVLMLLAACTDTADITNPAIMTQTSSEFIDETPRGQMVLCKSWVNSNVPSSTNRFTVTTRSPVRTNQQIVAVAMDRCAEVRYDSDATSITVREFNVAGQQFSRAIVSTKSGDSVFNRNSFTFNTSNFTGFVLVVNGPTTTSPESGYQPPSGLHTIVENILVSTVNGVCSNNITHTAVGPNDIVLDSIRVVTTGYNVVVPVGVTLVGQRLDPFSGNMLAGGQVVLPVTPSPDFTSTVNSRTVGVHSFWSLLDGTVGTTQTTSFTCRNVN